MTATTLVLLFVSTFLQAGALLSAMLTMRAVGRVDQDGARGMDLASRRRVRALVRRGRVAAPAEQPFAAAVARTVQLERFYAITFGLLGASFACYAVAWSAIPVAPVVFAVIAAASFAMAVYVLVVARRARGLLPAPG